MTTLLSKWVVALERAGDIGTSDGIDAAMDWLAAEPNIDWAYVRDALDGLNGAETDFLPQPDLSGTWADRMSGPDLVNRVLDIAGIDPDTQDAWDGFDDICTHYESAFYDAVADVIRNQLDTMRP